MKSKKPFLSSLPGKYGKLTRAQLDAESNQYDREFSAISLRPSTNRRPHPKKRGRPRKPANEKAARVLLTMEPALLAAADAAADRSGLTRARLFDQAVREWLSADRRRERSVRVAKAA